jgi:hypothetical protein
MQIVSKCMELHGTIVRDCRRWMWSVDPEVFTLSFYSKNFRESFYFLKEILLE